MTASVFDSHHMRGMMGDAEVARLLSDGAEIRAMLLALGALAKVQGAQGTIPEVGAAAIHRASLEIQIDPGALAARTATDGVPVPALVAAFRDEMKAPEHARYVHWGATSQDILDTGLALRLRQVMGLYDARLRGVVGALGVLAEDHATLPMVARTWGQHAVPTSFGAVCAGWGAPLGSMIDGLGALRPHVARVSLSGAGGTNAALGAEATATRAALAEALGLADPGRDWHADRTGIAGLAAWCATVTGALGKMGADLERLAATELGEVRLPGAGGSSTMPHKANPVAPSLLVALARFAAPQAQVLAAALPHAHQRDGAAWMAEWMALPPLLMATGRALTLAEALARGIVPQPAAMERNLGLTRGRIQAEALTFALADRMPRPEAARLVADLCARVGAGEGDLETLAAGLDVPPSTFAHDLGRAPDEARAFAHHAARVAGEGA
ncbi:MAG: lyase family protein [Shimia sp.]